MMLQNLLGAAYEVRNFGVSSRTMLKRGDFPYWKDKAYQEALAFNPNVVVIDLGGNDSKPQNWQYKSEFAADTRAMIESFRALAVKPRVLLCLPMPAFKIMWGIAQHGPAGIPVTGEFEQKRPVMTAVGHTPSGIQY